MEPLKKQDPKQIGGYTILARLGSGGMGTVYLASRGETTVALKVVSGGFEDDSALKSRFIREIENLQKMRSPFIAGIIDSKVEDSGAWLAVRYVNGPNLYQEVTREGRLSDQKVWEIAIGSLIALAQIHSLGVVHRDVKPANLLLSETGPKLIDFGISHRSDDTSLTTTGLVAGSPAWLAPEQLDVGEVTSAADIFSFASLLIFARTGQSPWGNHNTMSVPILFNKILSEAPDLSSLTGNLRKIISPALAKNPDHRPTAVEVLSDAIQVAPVGVLRRIRTWLEIEEGQSPNLLKIDPIIDEVTHQIDLKTGVENRTPSPALRGPKSNAELTDQSGIEKKMPKAWQKGFRYSALATVAGVALIAGAVITYVALPGDQSSLLESQENAVSDEAVAPQVIASPNYLFTTVSDSGNAALSPGDGTQVFANQEFKIELSFAEAIELEPGVSPELNVIAAGSANEETSCLGNLTMETSESDPSVFEHTCEGLAEGSYIVRVVWSARGGEELAREFERETITAFIEVTDPPAAESSSEVAPPSGPFRYEFLGGGWGAWDDAQYFSMSGNALIRTWCLRSAPGIAWRDDNNWAEVLNSDGSIAERVASTQNQGACTITGSVNGMEDGNPGELRAIVVPRSTLAPRLIPGECLIVRFKPGGTSFEPEFNDICVRG